MNFIGNYVLLYKKEERENLAVYVNKHWYIMKRTDTDRTTEQRQTDGQREIPGALQAELINLHTCITTLTISSFVAVQFIH